MKPRKIHFVCSSDPAHDAPHGFMPALSLSRAGYDVECICQGDSAETHLELDGHALPTKRLRRRKSLLGGLILQLELAVAMGRRRIASSKNLFIVSSSAVTPAAAMALWRLDPKRIIYHTQDFLDPGRHGVWIFFERAAARQAGRVICNEPNRARCLASLYQLDHLPAVLPTHLPASWPMPAYDEDLRHELLQRAGRPVPENARLVMHSGELSTARCGLELLRAMDLLPKNYVLVTGTASPAWRRHESFPRLQSEGRLVLLPHLPHQDLLRHCACCDLGLLLYPNDGIGNFFQAPGRLTEYLGAGLPLVASNFTGLEALVCGYELGRVCDPAEPNDIARAIRELGEIPADRRLAERERLRVLAKTEFAYDNAEPLLHRLVNESLPAADLPSASPSFPSSFLRD